MSSYPAFVLCLVLASMGVYAHHAASESSPLVKHTHEAHHTLSSLPTHCSQGATELILAEETRVTKLIGSCSMKTIFFYGSELLTDTAYFGFSLFNNGKTLYSDFEVCTEEKYTFEKVFCVLKRALGALKSVVQLAMSAISYVLQVKDLLPKVIGDIEDCMYSKVTDYQRFLDGVVKKAVMC